MLLADLWLGGLRIRKNANVKVVVGVLMPPTILALHFKSKEELLLQAQTAEEFEGKSVIFYWGIIVKNLNWGGWDYKNGDLWLCVH